VPLTNLEKAVEKKAREQADAILAKARKDADARLRRDSEHLREEHAHRLDLLGRELEADLDRQVGDGETKNRREVLRVKNEIMSELFDRALDGIVSLPGNGYAQWLGAQLKKLPNQGKDMVLRVNPRDKDLLAQQAKALGIVAPVADQDDSLRGGFVAQGKGRDLVFTTTSLMQAIRDTLSEKVVSALFESDAKS
jgi:V/A-type H+-transporting ATPase subunit E